MQTPSRAASIDQGVSTLAELFGLSHVLSTSVDRISGGQRRRVSLAETLATQARWAKPLINPYRSNAYPLKTSLL